MVFGVFAARKDSSPSFVNEARESMLSSYNLFLDDGATKASVASFASQKIAIPEDRIVSYFESEVSNILDKSSIEGLQIFLDEVCEMKSGPIWFESA